MCQGLSAQMSDRRMWWQTKMEFCHPEQSSRRSEESVIRDRSCHPERSEGSGSWTGGNFYCQQVWRGLSDSSLPLRMTVKVVQNDRQVSCPEKRILRITEAMRLPRRCEQGEYHPKSRIYCSIWCASYEDFSYLCKLFGCGVLCQTMER